MKKLKTVFAAYIVLTVVAISFLLGSRQKLLEQEEELTESVQELRFSYEIQEMRIEYLLQMMPDSIRESLVTE